MLLPSQLTGLKWPTIEHRRTPSYIYPYLLVNDGQYLDGPSHACPHIDARMVVLLSSDETSESLIIATMFAVWVTPPYSLTIADLFVSRVVGVYIHLSALGQFRASSSSSSP